MNAKKTSVISDPFDSTQGHPERSRMDENVMQASPVSVADGALALGGEASAPKKARRSVAKDQAAQDTEAVRPKIRIKIKAYDHKIIDTSAHKIVDTALRAGCEVQGPVPLPTEKHRYTVNRSTFVHKDSREQFELRVHKRLLDIVDPTPKLVDALTNLNLPAGVDIEIKMS